METYQPIQSIPQGLLHFLQLKNAGRNPSEINSLLQTTMDLRDWLWQTSPTEALAGTAAAIGATGFAGPYLTIPQNEWWVLYECEAQINQTLATDWVYATPCYRMGSSGVNSNPWLLAPLTLVNRGAAQDPGPMYKIGMNGNANGMPRIIPPGAEFGIWTSSFAGGPDALCNVVVRITRLRA